MAGISNDLFPPIIDSYMPGFLPAHGCRVYFSISSYNNFEDISKAEISLKYQTDNSSALSAETMEIAKADIVIDNLKTSNDKYYFDLQTNNFVVGTVYKLQIRLYDKENNYSEWSTVCLLKPIAMPIVNVELFNNKDSLAGDVAISANVIEFYGNLSWENSNQAEVLYYYQLDLYKKSTDKLIESSGMIYTDTNVQVFNYIFQHELEDNEAYYIKLTYCFTSMYIGIETYDFVYFPFKNTVNTKIELQASDEDGYIAVYVDMKELVPGNYALLRTSSDSDFKLWDTYYYFTKDANAEDIKVVIEDLSIDINKSLMAAAPEPEESKSGQYHVYYDHTIQSGVLYKYKIQRLGLNNIRIADSDESEPIMSYFNHMFLGDKDFKLKVKFDPTVDSFKKNIVESKTDTLGGKYPIIRRNGASNYQSFSISGLIAIEDEDFENWKKSKDKDDEWDIYYYQKYGVRRTNDFVSEKAFRDKVSSFLHDGKIKLFRSIQEGNFLVRLMNVSLTAKKELGRMLYSFSAEATEVAECNYNNYIKYNIIEDTEMPEGKVAAFTLPVVGQIKSWGAITPKIDRKYNINYNYQTYQLKGAIIPESISYKITNLNENEIFDIAYLMHKGDSYYSIQVAPRQTITLPPVKQLHCDVNDYWLIEYEGYVEYTYQYANEYSYKVQYINNNVGQLKILANEDIIAIITEKYNNEDLYRQIEDITRLTFNNLSDEDIKVNIEYSDGITSDITIASNNIYTLMSQGSKDIKSIKPESDIYIDYNYILSTKVIESEE
jgi:hypothetical protein